MNSRRCAGLTAIGRRCSNWVLPPRVTCRFHMGEHQTDEKNERGGVGVNRRQCVAPTKSGRRCQNMVPMPKVICHIHIDEYQTDEAHGGECDCVLCELARSQPIGRVEFNGVGLLMIDPYVGGSA